MPKLFISYSWTSSEYQEEVLSLATDLRMNGVDVILDKWHLREGDDAHAFMEQMVTDPSVDKVLILGNRRYVEKANIRDGGVGTETQIITPELYGKKAQDKFVVAVMERMEDGSECVPAYYRSRIHIDFSKPADAAENFDRLLRWIYNRPLHVAPPIGKPPAFLETGIDQPTLATATFFRRAQDAVRNHKSYAEAAVIEYFNHFADGMEEFRIKGKHENIDETVIESIQAFVPYRNECLALIYDIASNIKNENAVVFVQRFLERMAAYMYKPEHVSLWNNCDFDNYKFLVHEIFLNVVAIFIKVERFSDATILCGDYYAPYASGRTDIAMESYHMFYEYIASLDMRNQRLQLRRVSLHADLLKERCTGFPVSFGELMQADFALYFRSIIKNGMLSWFPVTLIYAGRDVGPFEIFARSKSRRYLAKLMPLLGAESKENIDFAINSIDNNYQLLPFRRPQISVRRLIGYDQLTLSE